MREEQRLPSVAVNPVIPHEATLPRERLHPGAPVTIPREGFKPTERRPTPPRHFSPTLPRRFGPFPPERFDPRSEDERFALAWRAFQSPL